MKYEKIHKAKFLERPNRFIAMVELDGKTEIVHVKNTGRCSELLVEGATVYLNEPSGKERKTKFDLVAVEKKKTNGDCILINMDSSAPNYAVAEWLPKSGLFADDAIYKSEVKKGNSRFDFSIAEKVVFGTEIKEKTTYLEVKGVTLEQNGTVMFPDAPTERGVKHLRELSDLCLEGFGSAIIFVVQMKNVDSFKPNKATHPEFTSALKRAYQCGVKIYAYDCVVTADEIKINEPIKNIIL